MFGPAGRPGAFSAPGRDVNPYCLKIDDSAIGKCSTEVAE